MTLCASAVPAAPPPPDPSLLPQPVDPVHHRDWEDYGMDPDGPDYPHASDDIDFALAALMNGMLILPQMIWRLCSMISLCI